MHALLTEMSMQPEPTNTAQPSAPAHGGRPPPQGMGGAEMQFGLLALMFVLFYFLMIRPQQKRQRETESMLKALKRGDVVRTTGGIRGEITDLSDSDVTLLIADKVKINVLRAHIAGKAAVEAKEKS